MPLLTRCFVRAALVYLVLGLAVGVALAAPAGVRVPPLVLTLAPVYFHLLMVGWVTQLIIGVSLWMFPRGPGGGASPSSALGWGTFVGLNAGLVLRAVAEPAHALDPRAGWGAWLAVSALLQWLAGVAYVTAVWPRVRGR
jgi:hypothetical protein